MNKPKVKVKKRIRYKHRMANPKVGWTRKYQENCDQIDWEK